MKTEFQLIDSFARGIRRGATRVPGVVTGVGDDAAVLRPSRGEDLVVTADSLVEGVHFERRWFSGRELGWRLAAVNLSDLAAMAAAPRYALVSMAIPHGVPDRYVEGIERGVVEHLAAYRAVVVGGNVSSIDGPLVLDLTLIGACARGKAWRRRAKSGDAILLAGVLGAAGAGVVRLAEGRTGGPLVRAYRKPVPRLDVARALAARRGIHGAIDVSDGLSSDVIHLCEASGLGCDIDAAALPIPRAVAAFCREHGLDPLRWGLHAGEDYGLILAVAGRDARRVRGAIERAGVPAAVIGRVTPHRGRYRLLDAHGHARRFEARGWDHLKPKR